MRHLQLNAKSLGGLSSQRAISFTQLWDGNNHYKDILGRESINKYTIFVQLGVLLTLFVTILV